VCLCVCVCDFCTVCIFFYLPENHQDPQTLFEVTNTSSFLLKQSYFEEKKVWMDMVRCEFNPCSISVLFFYQAVYQADLKSERMKEEKKIHIYLLRPHTPQNALNQPQIIN